MKQTKKCSKFIAQQMFCYHEHEQSQHHPKIKILPQSILNCFSMHQCNPSFAMSNRINAICPPYMNVLYKSPPILLHYFSFRLRMNCEGTCSIMCQLVYVYSVLS